MLFNFYRVLKYLYIHLQVRRFVPKSAGVYVMSSYKEQVMKEKVFNVINETETESQGERDVF